MPVIDPLSDCRVAEFIATQPSSDYQEYLAGFDARRRDSRLERLAAAPMGKAAIPDAAPGCGTLWAADRADAELSALARLEFLPWDGECLGFGVARLGPLYGTDAQAKTAVVRELLRAARKNGGRLISARVAARDFSSIHALESAGFRTVDAMNVFLWRRGAAGAERRHLPKGLPPPALGEAEAVIPVARGGQFIDRGLNWLRCTPPGPLTPQQEERALAINSASTDPPEGAPLEILPLKEAAGGIEAARALAPQAFRCGRLYNDPRVTAEQAQRFYGRLFDSLLAHPDALAYTAIAEGRVCGFVIGKPDRQGSQRLHAPIGCLELLAVHPSAAGRGVATALGRRFLHELGRSVGYIEVATQIHNHAALNLYAGLGLSLAGSLVTLHAWLEPRPARRPAGRRLHATGSARP